MPSRLKFFQFMAGESYYPMTESHAQTGPSSKGGTAQGVSDKDLPKARFYSFDNLKSLGVLMLAILALRWSVASPYHVPTASMEPTIKVGDRLLAFKLAYDFKIPFTDITVAQWGSPKRGDIIVFKYPREPDIDYVKRVVAVAGDEVHFADDILYVNGEAQQRVSAEDQRQILDDIEDQKEIKQLYKETLFGMDHWVMQNIPSARRFTRSSWPPPGAATFPPSAAASGWCSRTSGCWITCRPSTMWRCRCAWPARRSASLPMTSASFCPGWGWATG